MYCMYVVQYNIYMIIYVQNIHRTKNYIHGQSLYCFICMYVQCHDKIYACMHEYKYIIVIIII